MVCKEKLSIWFKNLSPHKRIDFMCGMLHMCLPMELRFMGSYVEDLAKKDFLHLRDSESKANSRNELSKFSEKDGKAIRTKMAVYLALLHSSNRTCSNIIFDLLEDNIKDAFTILEDMDELTIHNILLVLSMAMHHPAFSNHQRSKMYKYYKAANEATTRILKMEADYELFSTEPRHYDQRTLSPAYSPHHPVHLSYSPVVTNKVHVCNIEVKGVRPRGAEKKSLEYRLQVTWSNGEETEVFKSYQELEDFHNLLLKKIPEEVPEEARILTQSINLPVLQESLNHMETLVVLNEYVKSVSQMPLHLLQCNFLLNFFGSGAPQIQMTDAATSPRPQADSDLQENNDETVILPYINKASPVYSTYLHQSQTSEVCPLPPAELTVQDEVAHSLSCSSKMTSPLISSPCRSSVSSMESPPLSNPNSPSLQERDAAVRLAPVLNMSSLPQYGNPLCQEATDQLGSLRQEETEDQGSKEMPPTANVVPGPAGKYVMDMKVREKLVAGHMANGLLEHPPVLWHQAMPHVPYIPHGMAPYPYPPPVQPMYSYPVYPSNTSSSTVRDYSPANSVNSSPSPSPNSSSEDSEKDKPGSQPTVNGKCKGGAAVGPPGRSVRHGGKAADDAGGYPAGNENTNNGQQGYSGYTSDPTYNAPRPQLIRPSYKAQPAHTNMTMGQKMYISMPDSNYKHGASVFPIGLPHHMNLTSSGNPAMADAIPRHLMLFPGGPAMINRNYPMAQINNSRQVFSNGMLQSNPGLNHSLNASSMGQNGGNNGSNGNKMYHHPVSSVVLPTPPSPGLAKTGVLLNGSETNVGPPQQQKPQQGSVDLCNLRTVTSSSVPSTSTITYSAAAAGYQSSTPSPGGCSHCGCSGTHTHTSTSQQPVPQTPIFPYNGLPQAAHGMWPSFPNGMVHMPSPGYQYANGLHHELLYNMQSGLGSHNIHQAMSTPAVYGMYGYSSFNTPATQANPGAYPKKPKKTNCHNCGSSKHMASECNEVSMEAMSGHSMYSYKPRSDSE